MSAARTPIDVRRTLKPALIAGAVLLAANALVYAFLVRPRVLEYRDLSGTQEQFLHQLNQAEASHRKLADFYSRLSATKANTEDFYKKILRTKQENLIEVQREVNEIGSEFGIDPDTVSYASQDLPADGLERFSISLLLEGDYAALRKLIARVESSESFLIVDSISLTGTREGGLQLQMAINISTYFDAPWLKEADRRSRTSPRRGA